MTLLVLWLLLRKEAWLWDRFNLPNRSRYIKIFLPQEQKGTHNGRKTAIHNLVSHTSTRDGTAGSVPIIGEYCIAGNRIHKSFLVVLLAELAFWSAPLSRSLLVSQFFSTQKSHSNRVFDNIPQGREGGILSQTCSCCQEQQDPKKSFIGKIRPFKSPSKSPSHLSFVAVSNTALPLWCRWRCCPHPSNCV